MRYNVAQLLKGPIGGTRQYWLDEDLTALDKDLKPLARLEGQVQFLRSGEGILATGNLSTQVELACDRCLRPFAVPMTFTLEEEFRPAIDIVTGASLPVVKNDEGTQIDAHHILDLSEVVRQGILLAIPMHPLCRPDCAGLCPRCGENLNTGPCACPAPEGDPRWDALRQLLPEQ